MLKRHILATAVAAALSVASGVAMSQSTPEESLSGIIDKVNDALEAQGAQVRLFSADVMSRGRSGGHHHRTHWRNAKFNRMDAEFVPNDVRREPFSGPVVPGAIDDITFAIDQADAVPPKGGLTVAQTTGAIRRAMATWDSVRCSGLVLREIPAHTSAGIVAWALAGMPGGPFAAPALAADILHAGFRLNNWAGAFSPTLKVHDDAIAVTFTFVAGDGNGLTDIDKNSKADIIFQEIYYNADVAWKIDTRGRRDHDDDDDDRRGRNRGHGDDDAFDVQTVALHEAGHALSLEHYGTVVERKGGRLDAKPEAVMNPVYTGTMQRLQKPDIAAHCVGGWKTWPRNRK